MKISELIATLEDIRSTNGDVDVYITNLGTGVSGKVESIDVSNVVEITARHMDIDLTEDNENM